MKYIFVLLAAALWSCGHAGRNHDTHAGHNHDAHAGHNHPPAEHNHAHEGCGHSLEEPAAESHGDEIIFTREQAREAGLAVETVAPGEFSRVVKTGGTILNAPGSELLVAARTGGIVSLTGSLAEGTRVAKGDIIATISARGVVDGDAAARARIEFAAAEREYRRAEQLAAGQIVSQKEFDEARRRYETARASLPEGDADSGVKATAPAAGYIKDILVRGGEYVSAGQPVATVIAADRLQLRADVPERFFGELPSITGANFKTSYSPALRRAGRLLSYGRAAEGGYVPVTFEVADAEGVVSGSFVEVWLTGRPEQNVLTVPVGALVEQQGVYYVYVQLDDEGYARREVLPGRADGGRVPLTGGLRPGERVVTRGAVQLRLASMSSAIPAGHTH